jgi:hypothetical protein
VPPLLLLLLLLLFLPAGLTPQDVDILITNCSIYCPTPSISSMVINMFHMREDIESYHLGGEAAASGALTLPAEATPVCMSANPYLYLAAQHMSAGSRSAC